MCSAYSGFSNTAIVSTLAQGTYSITNCRELQAIGQDPVTKELGDLEGKYILANDLGTDKIYVYQYNSNSATEVLTLKSSIDVKPGSGPRHLIFSKNGKYVYVFVFYRFSQ